MLLLRSQLVFRVSCWRELAHSGVSPVLPVVSMQNDGHKINKNVHNSLKQCVKVGSATPIL